MAISCITIRENVPARRFEVIHMPGPIAQTDIDHILELYRTGVSLHGIGKRVGVDFKTADKYVRESGIPKRTKAETAALISRSTMGRAPTRLPKPIPDEVCDLYRNGADLRSLEARFEIDRKRLSSHLKASGVSVTMGRTTPGRLQAAIRGSQAAKLAPRNDEGRARTNELRNHMVGEGERQLLDALRLHGLNPTHQLAVDSYNIDVAIDEFRVAVEVQRGSWHGSTSAKRERVEHLFNGGWRVVFVQVSRHGAISDWSAIGDKLITYLDCLRRDPSAPGQYGMLRRDGKPGSRLPDYFNDWTRIPGL